MPLSVATWNINSVRLRLKLVLDYLERARPHVLCLQETKCLDDLFPRSAFRDIGYAHQAIRGDKGYNGVAILSRLPLGEPSCLPFGRKGDARHIAAEATLESGARVTVHNFYVPAGGDIANPELNVKFAHKLGFLKDMREWSIEQAGRSCAAVVTGDLNVAPYESDVWSHKQLLDVVSHTPVETETLEDIRRCGEWTDAVRHRIPEPERVYTWWSYRALDWMASNRGRRLDHIWVSAPLAGAIGEVMIETAARGLERPSDHVPVLLSLNL
ncbi:MAG: exodeoxyribonuclease III [Hyphomicrobiales bacterium]|nr:exodeoxyribonuclease III [Hyphomicrobiales bacterium]